MAGNCGNGNQWSWRPRSYPNFLSPWKTWCFVLCKEDERAHKVSWCRIFHQSQYVGPFSSVQLLSHVRLFATPWTAAHQASLSITNSWSPPKSCPLSQWCHPTTSSPVVPFPSHLQSFPSSGSFPVSQFFASGVHSIGVSASTSVLPMNTQDWFPLGWTGWISLQSKGLSRVFSNTTVQKHQFFGTHLFL